MIFLMDLLTKTTSLTRFMDTIISFSQSIRVLESMCVGVGELQRSKFQICAWSLNV